ncbi:MAG: hypothetical protein LBE76_04240 [Nitrososphaerota archaeon]|jgi:hypothetical protein|nr:hypothetical protein [Nitrososphaerota archaeon]
MSKDENWTGEDEYQFKELRRRRGRVHKKTIRYINRQKKRSPRKSVDTSYIV